MHRYYSVVQLHNHGNGAEECKGTFLSLWPRVDATGQPNNGVDYVPHHHEGSEASLDGLSELTNCEPPNTPNTPVLQHYSQSGPDVVQLKQLLMKLFHDEYSSAKSLAASKPIQPCLATNEQEENVRVLSGIDLNRPICTSPDNLKSFETWASHASTPQFKTVVEKYELPATLSFWRNITDTGLAGTRKHVNTR